MTTPDPHPPPYVHPQPQPAAYLPPTGPYQQQPFAPPEAHYPTAANGNQLALTSLICGIVAVLCCGPFTGIPAIITGFMARRQIATSAGTQSGQTQALWGIILGAVAIVLTFIAAGFLLLLLVAGGSAPDPHYSY